MKTAAWRPLLATVLLITPLGLASCGTHTETAGSSSAKPSSSTSHAVAGCPLGPIDVVVSVDQWGDIVSELGGACATVKTILASSSVDPHDYEPSPADAANFSGAQLVVLNGVGYDSWASKLAATSAANAEVVDAGQVTKTADGANPHLWYSPPAVDAVADAVTAALIKLQPQATDLFNRQHAAFVGALGPYNELLAKIKSAAAGKSYAATEPVFDYQAQALGLVNKTPVGFQNAAANDSDPAPADIAAFTSLLASRQVDVLIYNTQTEGTVPEQIRAAAQQAGVQIVDVTETVPPGQHSFEGWQDAQLHALAKALGINV